MGARGTRNPRARRVTADGGSFSAGRAAHAPQRYGPRRFAAERAAAPRQVRPPSAHDARPVDRSVPASWGRRPCEVAAAGGGRRPVALRLAPFFFFRFLRCDFYRRPLKSNLARDAIRLATSSTESATPSGIGICYLCYRCCCPYCCSRAPSNCSYVQFN